MTTRSETSGEKGKVYVTIHKLGTDEELTFQDGDTIGHLIQAVGASEELELRISGKDVRKMDPKTPLRSGMEADATSRRGSHG